MKTFDELREHIIGKNRRWRIAVACAADESTRTAVATALENGLVEAFFVGDTEAVKADGRLMHSGSFVHTIDAIDDHDAAAKAVALVKEGIADVLMKGLLNTDILLKAILDKQNGLLPQGNVLTHITIAQLPMYDKLLMFSDGAVIPFPTLQQRLQQVKYMVELCHDFGIDQPRIALTHCTEKTNVKTFPVTADYETIVQEARNGRFGNCIIDGPLDVKTSCSLHSLQLKGIDSPIQGKADALIFPDIEAGNTFYKTITLFAQAQAAATLQGTSAPVVLPSRGDDTMAKFNSIIMALAQCLH